MDIKELTTPCGLACWVCTYYKDNITDEIAQYTAEMLGMDAKGVSCEGCRSGRGCSFGNITTSNGGCTKNCVENKGLHNCSECNEFPCEKLMPAADMADRIPHNIKLYNLSRIKLLGLEGWADEASHIHEKYFKGTLLTEENQLRMKKRSSSNKK